MTKSPFLGMIAMTALASAGCGKETTSKQASRVVAESESAIAEIRAAVVAYPAPRFTLDDSTQTLSFRVDVQDSVASLGSRAVWIDGSVVDLAKIGDSYQAIVDNFESSFASREFAVLFRFRGLTHDDREAIRSKEAPYIACRGELSTSIGEGVSVSPRVVVTGDIEWHVGPPPLLINIDCDHVVVVNEPASPADAWNSP